MSEKNRDRLIEGILYYKEEIKNSEDQEYIEKCQKKIDEFLNQHLLSQHVLHPFHFLATFHVSLIFHLTPLGLNIS